MSEVIDEQASLYKPPEGLEPLHYRELANGNLVLLYVGEQAILDVVEIINIPGIEEIMGELLLRAESPKETAMDLFRHPSGFVDPEIAEYAFGRVKATAEDLFGLDQAA